MVGSTAMASGFATYLGVYSYKVRQKIVKFVWPKCLKDRGMMTDVNIADNLTVDITMSMAQIDTHKFVKKLESSDSYSADDTETSEDSDQRKGDASSVSQPEEPVKDSNTLAQDGTTGDSEPSPFDLNDDGKKQLEEVESLFSTKDNDSLHVYDQYILAILKLLTGDEAERNLISRGINYRELEDVSIFSAAVQTPLLIIDPFDTAMRLLQTVLGDVMVIDMSHR